MKKITAKEFSGRIYDKIRKHNDNRYAFFVGAGCSFSSGIPMAGGLVLEWLERLRTIKGMDEESWKNWLDQQWPKVLEQPSFFYGDVFKELCLEPVERQREIENQTAQKNPGFGYSVMAQLMTHPKYGEQINVALTTNFDDLIADALYSYTRLKPRSITHESLADFIRPSRNCPLIVKLHGDAHLDPKNTQGETKRLDDSVKLAVHQILNHSGLIFLGYGGCDSSIVNALKELTENALPNGIYWVNEDLPGDELSDWLENQEACWVDHTDFDEVMYFLFGAFQMEHPEIKSHWENVEKHYHETYKKLNERIQSSVRSISKSPHKNQKSLKQNEELMSIMAKELDWWDIEQEAMQFKVRDPDRADAIYREGIHRFPEAHQLIGNYALFLHEFCNKYEQAEEYYQRALNIDPNDANNLGNFAVFLENIRKDYDQSENYYQRALKADPEHAQHLSNYALFLNNIRNDLDQSEKYYRRVLEIDPNNATHLGNYAVFLENNRHDYHRAEEYYLRALKADPNSAFELGNFAKLLFILKRVDEGRDYLQRALVQPELTDGLRLELAFYQYAHLPEERKEALSELKQLLHDGVRSPGWHLEENVRRAIEDGHPSVEFLSILADVISENIDIGELERFEVWRDADKS